MGVEDKIEQIQLAFKKAKIITSLECFKLELPHLLLSENNEYISIIYEAASMGIAIESLKNTRSISEWVPFFESYRDSHSSQILVGLGWAIYEFDAPINPIISPLIGKQQWRILDGYGYCHGLFKRTSSVRKQQIPEELSGQQINAYHQGLGRSLWYIAKGDVSRFLRMLELFQTEYQADLWRGAGIAITYVGGIEEVALITLKKEVKTNLKRLKTGIALALYSRKKAQSFSKDAELIANFFFTNVETIIQEIESVESMPYSSLEQYHSSLRDIQINL